MLRAISLILTVSLLSACGSNTVQTKTVYVENNTVCDIIKKPMVTHMRTMVDNGEKMIGAGADEVLVTGVDLSDTYKETCK